MTFELTKEQEMIRKEVRRFGAKDIAPVARGLDQNEDFFVEPSVKMDEISLFGMFVSEDYEGQDMYIIALQEIARVDASQTAMIAVTNSLGIDPVYYFGAQKQKKKYLPRLCTGEALWGFALTETTAGSDAGGSKTTAVLDRLKHIYRNNTKRVQDIKDYLIILV